MNRLRRLEPSAVKSTVPRKILVTLLTSAIAYLVTSVSQQAQIWAVVLATFIGGVALVVQFLMDFDARLQVVELTQETRLRSLEEGQRGHAAEMERLVREGFSKINEATELFGLVETSALRTDVVTQFVRHSTQIEPVPALVFDFAQAEIFRLSEFLKEVSKGGHVAYDGEDRDWLLGLTRHARSSIDATSLTTVDAGSAELGEGGLWTSDLGHRYLEVQREAVQRGVTVRRVFILDRPDLSAYPNLREVCRMQRDLGIEVRVLGSQQIPQLLRKGIFDFILFDEVVSYEVTPASWIEDTSSPIFVNTHLVLGDQRVKERIRRFRELWESARDLQE